MDDQNTILKIAKEKHIRCIPAEDIQVEKNLNAGSFALVCVGRDTQRQKRVAVKVLKSDKKPPEELAKELISEAEKMLCIRDENIVDFYGICVKASLYCLILPYMENGSVSGFFHEISCINSGLPVANKVDVAWCIRLRMLYEIASGIIALHSHKIIHLDLKASNVLLNEELHVKIADFGLSRWHKVDNFLSKTVSHLGGTPTHIPPEYLKAHDKTPTAEFDVYSYAILTWELLTGKDPYSNIHVSGQIQLYMEVINGRRPDINIIPQCIPPEYNCINTIVTPLMQQCWQGNPADRKTMTEIKDALDTLNMKTERDKARGEVPKLLEIIDDQKKKELEKITNYTKPIPLEDHVMKSLRPELQLPNVDMHQNRNRTPENLAVEVNALDRKPNTKFSGVDIHDHISKDQQIHGQPKSADKYDFETDGGSANPTDFGGRASSSQQQQKMPNKANPTDFCGRASGSQQQQKMLNKGERNSANANGDTHIHHNYNARERVTVNTTHITSPNSVHIGPTHVQQRVPATNQYKDLSIDNDIIANPDLKTNGIHLQDEKGKVSIHHMKEIVHRLGKRWRKLARDCLLFKDGELDALEWDYRDIGLLEIIHQMFRQWQEKHGHKANREWLATGLVYINRKELVVEILNK